MSARLPRLRSFTTAMLAIAVPAALAVAVAAPAASARTHGPDNEFRQTNLVSDLTTVGAQIVDPNLKNPWGLAFGPTTPLWVADNNAAVATVYTVDASGATAAKGNLTVALPGGRESGQVGSKNRLDLRPQPERQQEDMESDRAKTANRSVEDVRSNGRPVRASLSRSTSHCHDSTRFADLTCMLIVRRRDGQISSSWSGRVGYPT